MDVGSVRRKFHFVAAGMTRELFGFRGGRNMVKESLLQFSDGLGGPRACVEDVNGLSREAQVHGSHGELHAAAALDEDDGVVVWDSKKTAELLFRGGVDAFKFRGTVAHLHHGHAAAAPVEKLLANAFENRERKRPRTGVEVVDALGGAGADGCVSHGVGFLFRVAFSGSNAALAIMVGFPE